MHSTDISKLIALSLKCLVMLPEPHTMIPKQTMPLLDNEVTNVNLNV